jgi:hypothetical protein
MAEASVFALAKRLIPLANSNMESIVAILLDKTPKAISQKMKWIAALFKDLGNNEFIDLLETRRIEKVSKLFT